MSNIMDEWKRVESGDNQPRRVRTIIQVPYIEFKKKIESDDPEFVKKFVESVYAGDAYVLRSAFTKEYMDGLKEKCFAFARQNKSSFHKILEGTPNFHRMIDEKVADNYTLHAIKHAWYIFPWNEDSIGAWEPTWERWKVVKLASGLEANEFEGKTPKDGRVNRLQISHYPLGVGGLGTHSDPWMGQRLVFSGIMSTKGKDYQEGGVYFVDKDDKAIDGEPMMETGDVYIFYPTVHHGVADIDPGKHSEWDSTLGRWWLGPFVVDSDYIKERHTGYKVEAPKR